MPWPKLHSPEDDHSSDAHVDSHAQAQAHTRERASLARTHELVLRLRADDADAFRTTYLTQYHRLWEFAYSFVQDDSAAEDVVHDVFAALWASRATLHIETTIDAYLFAAVRNRALNLLRHARMTDRTHGRFPSATETAGSMPGMAHAAPLPDSVAAADELDVALHDAIAQLPPGQQQAILLHWRHGLSNPEIARVMETSVATVAVHISRARETLRRVAARFLGAE